MKTTCIVNNYNYGRFIIEAVDSALRQSFAFDEIIIVDDCSTDDSVKIIKERYSNNPGIKLMLKERNEGQLSCFNAGFAAATGDIIFFLDSDDVYEKVYLEAALKVYKEHPECDFLISGWKEVADNRESPFSADLADLERATKDFGFLAIATIYTRELNLLKGRTSAISMKKEILERFMPIEIVRDWKISADICICYGALLSGARQFLINLPLVKYRVHGNNLFLGRQKDIADIYLHRLTKNRLMNFLVLKIGYGKDIYEAAPYEFKTIKKPSLRSFFLYLRIILFSDTYFFRKIHGIGMIARHFFKSMIPASPAGRHRK